MRENSQGRKKTTFGVYFLILRTNYSQKNPMTFYWPLLKFLPQRGKEKNPQGWKEINFCCLYQISSIWNQLDLKPSFSFHQIPIHTIFEELFRKEILVSHMGFRTNNSQSKRYIVIDLCYINFQYVYQIAWSETKCVFHHMTSQIRRQRFEGLHQYWLFSMSEASNEMFSPIWQYIASSMKQKTFAILECTDIHAPWSKFYDWE